MGASFPSLHCIRFWSFCIYLDFENVFDLWNWILEYKSLTKFVGNIIVSRYNNCCSHRSWQLRSALDNHQQSAYHLNFSTNLYYCQLGIKTLGKKDRYINYFCISRSLWKVAMGAEYCNSSWHPPDNAGGGCAPSSMLAHSWSRMYEVKKRKTKRHWHNVSRLTRTFVNVY